MIALNLLALWVVHLADWFGKAHRYSEGECFARAPLFGWCENEAFFVLPLPYWDYGPLGQNYRRAYGWRRAVLVWWQREGFHIDYEACDYELQ